jgi:NADPH:quinone reductase-like Zn-dependent oxidoreductase
MPSTIVLKVNARNSTFEVVADLLQDFEEEIKKVTDGVDHIIDFVAADYLAKNLSLMRRDGYMVNLASLSGQKIPEGVNFFGPLLGKRLTIRGSSLRSRTLKYQAYLMQQFEKKALPRIVDGTMRVEVHEVSVPSAICIMLYLII